MNEENEKLSPLLCPVPEMLERAIGYVGNARLVGFFFGGDDEASYSDGRITAQGSWYAFDGYINHPLIAPHVYAFDFGSSNGPPVHWLILDREKRQLVVALVAEAQRLLREQWPISEASQLQEQTDEDEYLQLIQALIVRQPHLSRRLSEQWQEHQRQVKALMAWLAERWEEVL